MQHNAACIWETPKRVLFQKQKVQMKCSIMLHVYGKPLKEYFSKTEDPEKKLKGHIALGLFVYVYVRVCRHPIEKI